MNAPETDDLVECPACEGDGITPDDDFEDCPTCLGDGKVYREDLN